jgi:hypothetical protein
VESTSYDDAADVISDWKVKAALQASSWKPFIRRIACEEEPVRLRQILPKRQLVL